MKIICTQENLKAGLSTVGRIISSTNTLPILNNILLKTENGTLKISSTNLEIAITTQTRCKVEEEGEITVANKTFTELINSLPNKNLTLQAANGELKIETENYHTSVKTLPAEEFPLIPTVEKDKTFTIDTQELKKVINQVAFAASNNQNQLEITGVYMNLEGEELKVVATDRYRLAERKIKASNPKQSQAEAIVPQKAITELSRIIGNQKEQVEISLNENQISISLNETQIISRLIDGQYPDYKQIIPNNFYTTTTIPKQALASALKAAAIFAQSTNSVNFQFSPETQKLIITTESQELGKSEVELPSKIEGREGKVILNHHYVLDCLNNIDAENIVIKVIDDSSPSVIVQENNNEYIYLVMPIKN
ncbi:MAG: DNA polymerase III subunit beta [Candidatus Doudnabacteria bacterium]|nr:DNA polymerase III subunit beta [Candidatus Doudnabacteria bacterium]